jgi:phospholipase C
MSEAPVPGVPAGARPPDSLPDPGKPAGAVDDEMPFDHIVVVMMENHSFDNVLGALSRSGQGAADGLSFDAAGEATNSNPGASATTSTVPVCLPWSCRPTQSRTQ